MAIDTSTGKYCAPVRNVNSRAPAPPNVMGITAAMEDTRKSARYAKMCSYAENEDRIDQQTANWRPWISSDKPKLGQ